MAQWCAYSWTDPINAHVYRASVFQSAAGKAADLGTGDKPETYRAMREQRLEGRCVEITAAVIPEAPASPSLVYVGVSARRTLVAAGRPFEVETVSSVRRVVRDVDGRWLVDAEVEAG